MHRATTKLAPAGHFRRRVAIATGELRAPGHLVSRIGYRTRVSAMRVEAGCATERLSAARESARHTAVGVQVAERCRRLMPDTIWAPDSA